MKIITCTGFYGTGSSAITDLFSDCSNVACKGDFELRFVHDPDGISDLEYNLIDNPNRHNTSHAIKRFKKKVDFLTSRFNKQYEKYFNGQFRTASYRYIDSITEFKYLSKWHGDIVERGYSFWLIDRLYNKFFVILKKIFRKKNDVNHNILPKNEMAYAGIMDRQAFYDATKSYIENLFEIINPEGKEFLFVDQIVPPSNFGRFNNYLPGDTKIVVVDRDPRDIFLLEKLVWKGKVVPCYDVKLFCMWYRWTRRMFSSSFLPNNVIRIQFEDLVYDFENTRKKLFLFVGMNESNYCKKNFDPEISINNTRLWEKYPHFSKEMDFIGTELGEYCYRYNVNHRE